MHTHRRGKTWPPSTGAWPTLVRPRCTHTHMCTHTEEEGPGRHPPEHGQPWCSPDSPQHACAHTHMHMHTRTHMWKRKDMANPGEAWTAQSVHTQMHTHKWKRKHLVAIHQSMAKGPGQPPVCAHMHARMHAHIHTTRPSSQPSPSSAYALPSL